MLFERVGIAGVAHIDAPVRVTSAEIVRRLRPALERLHLRGDLLEEVAGIRARRIWDGPMPVAEAATLAARKALAASGVPAEKVGVLISTSVSRDYLEPSTACVVHGNLGLATTCQNFDLGNACLAFVTGMDVAARMIERQEIEFGLIVNGEKSNEITECTITRLNEPDTTVERFRQEFASLTLGSGAVAMVLGRTDLLANGHRYRGGVTHAVTEFSHLCRGTMDRMVTDTGTLLVEGLNLAATTYEAASAELGWTDAEPDEYAIHQVSKVHTDGLIERLGLDPKKVLEVFPEYGNVGPASVPLALSKLNDLGRLWLGSRVALLAIGSGLNCTMAEVIW